MTETNLSPTLQTTPLARILSARTQPELIEYRGILTPARFDAAEQETAALAHGAALYDLSWKRRVAVRGEDRYRWLSGMVTNTVNDLFPNTGAWNFVLNAQGHILGDLTVWRGAEELEPVQRGLAATAGDPLRGTPFAGASGLELEINACQLDRLLEHLNHFIIMDDVELVVLNQEVTGHPAPEVVFGLAGPQANEVLERVGLPSFSHPMMGSSVEWNGLNLRMVRNHGLLAPRYEFWVAATGADKFVKFLRAAGAVAVGAEMIEAYRIAEAIPAYGIDIHERDLPQEIAPTRALHFNKGCYQGQEIVERIHARGSVRRHLRPLEFTGPVPAPGTELKHEGAVAGTITSAAQLPLASGARGFAMAIVRAEAEIGDPQLNYAVENATGTARILATPPTL